MSANFNESETLHFLTPSCVVNIPIIRKLVEKRIAGIFAQGVVDGGYFTQKAGQEDKHRSVKASHDKKGEGAIEMPCPSY